MKYLLIILVTCSLGCKDSSVARISKVLDGDTYILSDGIRVRLWGCDAFELSQLGGKEAKDFAASLVLNKTVEITEKGSDKYNRKLCVVRIGGASLAHLMVSNGYAYCYQKYAPNALYNEFLLARRNGKGVFRFQDIQSPAEFRRKNNKLKN